MSGTESSLKIFVSRLPAVWGESDVRRYFEPHGELIQVSVFTGEGRGNLGCAYVAFARKSEAEEAIRTLSKSVPGTYTYSLARERCNSDGRTARLNVLDSSLPTAWPSTWNTSVPRGGLTTGTPRVTPPPGPAPANSTP